MLVLAVPFGDPAFVPSGAELSQSTWGPDYHRVIPPILGDVLSHLVGRRAARSAVTQVDSGPLEERAFALDMGLGRLGHNASILVGPWGPRVFLALALTRDPLPEHRLVPPGAAIFHPHCAECGQCLEACPTGALAVPGRVVALRCLSYVSQKRGFLPDALARRLGGRIYGCDECTRVCPLGRTRGLPMFSGRRRDRYPDAAGILTDGAEQYAGLWEGKAAAWRGRRLLERNAVNALGAAGSAADVPLLEGILSHPSPPLRAAAARSLGRLAERGIPVDLSPLRALAEDDPEDRVRIAAIRAARGRVGTPRYPSGFRRGPTGLH